MKTRTDQRTTISISRPVWEMAVAQMKLKRLNDNFSAYVAGLLRRDSEQQQKTARKK